MSSSDFDIRKCLRRGRVVDSPSTEIDLSNLADALFKLPGVRERAFSHLFRKIRNNSVELPLNVVNRSHFFHETPS